MGQISVGWLIESISKAAGLKGEVLYIETILCVSDCHDYIFYPEAILHMCTSIHQIVSGFTGDLYSSLVKVIGE